MERAAAELPPRPGASPGLLCRRYSVPETIMRKYRLAQQRSDSEESAPQTNRSVASASPGPGWDAAGSPGDTPHRFLRRDRELMRKSALLRRLWGRGCCCCEPAPAAGLGTRSLDGSRSELRQLSSGLASSRYSHAVGWTTPKRQRLDSSRDFRGSDEMIRAAMKNSYDRAEDPRKDSGTRIDLSDSTCKCREPSSYTETVTDVLTDSEGSKSEIRHERDTFPQYSERHLSETSTTQIRSSTIDDPHVTSEHSAAGSDERLLSDSSDTYSASYPTAQECLRSRPSLHLTSSAHIAGHVSEHSTSLFRDDNDAVPYDRPLTVHTPSYEVLEIVVSETLNVSSAPSASTLPPDKFSQSLRTPAQNQKTAQNINIDEYVSNILVESLNSLTDQLECMNASMGSHRKISIVEKEIKVKLQNTGVNTIVHLSPTSNNQIIFGNEELCMNEGSKDNCNNPPGQHSPQEQRDSELAIRDEHSVECNNNTDPFDLQHDAVNQAVLQQIQKLFQDEFHSLDVGVDYPEQTMPEISHIEISSATDVFINNDNELSTQARDTMEGRYEVISGVGTGSYYPDVEDRPVVPRFSALPHTDSMEVNTSSSEDADLMGSDCTSLVDSLDDPNSPRSVLLRRAFSNRRNELVRSAIDVLDLLPEDARQDEPTTPKDKGESFFIKIKDNECDCDKENVNVADRMPEKIKQRLYRRHRKREMRMECARRSRGKTRPREPQAERTRGRRDLERDCVAIVNALIDDVIAKVAQDEYKCMRIKHRPARTLASHSDDNVVKRTWKKELLPIEDRDPFLSAKSHNTRCDSQQTGKQRSERHQIHGKLSLVTRPAVACDDRAAKRIYQKSEIRDGNKCIEILEILEYVNGSQSSPETTNSDENHNQHVKNKKSRIPIPIYDKNLRSPTSSSSSRRSSMPRAELNGNTNRLIADMLLGALVESEPSELSEPTGPPPAPRRASVPRFKQTFDIIPEERSSLSLDSGSEDPNHNRRASDTSALDEPTAPPASAHPSQKLIKPQGDSPRRCKDMKSAATSPMTDCDTSKKPLRSKNQTTMTSPLSKSAATSPMRTSGTEGAVREEAPLASKRGRHAWLAQHGAGQKEMADKARQRRSTMTQNERHPNPQRHEHSTREERGERRRQPASGTSPSAEPRSDCSPVDAYIIGDKRKANDGMHSPFVKLPEFKGGGDSGAASSSDSSESGGSLLCSLAPKWLSQGRARRAARRRDAERPAPGAQPEAGAGPASPQQPGEQRAGRAPPACAATDGRVCRWLVGDGGGLVPRHAARGRGDALAVPARVAGRRRRALSGMHVSALRDVCVSRAAAGGGGGGGAGGSRGPPLPAAAPPLAQLARSDSSKLTLTMKKEALDSSILASKSSKKSGEPLPDVETYRASRSKLKSSVKTRRGYSLHCWLPDSEDAPLRASDGLSVLGSAIIPELKPRVPTMSERDLTRVYTPRHYLRL
ncbi:uncharacterized protein LOC118278261 isoform X1 [Spodoptera frugiperda]|uniref:Uncharacterized protein LOC118278261 isoform X1 n=1 Tax=Spodoptera frugiperda TaxID=7108 RepID=A0A9R0EZK0_SPOFR|nr:uncharacterized protein LOC118278261 isoform X1 [Spodoptera frugiperda]XP_050556110.1 uncharacterized protein LOC118278261 isoform X1 [Spodoptera frugiperda]XP_050556111.1 uncharacterized protein LOC118278261 isoform X1 [Spodoptera frugiperda]